MNIRRYEQRDIPEMIAALRQHIDKTVYKGMFYNEQKLTDICMGNLRNVMFFANIAEEDGKIVGGMFAKLIAPMFTTEYVAFDELLYIRPENRSMELATGLVASYISWAKERGMKKIFLSNVTGQQVETFGKFAEIQGFKKIGTIHVMEI